MEKHSVARLTNGQGRTVVFHALDAKNIESIARIQLKVLMARLQKMDLTMEVSEAAIAELAKVGFDPVFGARPQGDPHCQDEHGRCDQQGF